MALISTMEINGQRANSTSTYCYLYEPLRVIFQEDDSTATKLYIQLQVAATDASASIVDDISQYAEYDLNTSGEVSVDLMKIAQQYHDANIYKFAEVDDLADSSTNGWKAVVSQYKYIFRVTTDVTTSALEIVKLPILGGRNFQDFTPSVPQTNKLTEADVLGVTLTERWKDYPQLTCSLADPAAGDSTPTVSLSYATGGTTPCGGMVVWKSRLGGWMFWGMDLKKEYQSKQFTGSIPTGMFESTGPLGNPYVETSYTGIETNYRLVLKSLHLTQDELRAVQSITASPAVYYIANADGGVTRPRMELMRLTSATAPLDNRANGGDFSVSLSNISKTSQDVR